MYCITKHVQVSEFSLMKISSNNRQQYRLYFALEKGSMETQTESVLDVIR